jgi:hypothetical protein
MGLLFLEFILIVVYLYCWHWGRKLRRLERDDRRRWE